jgi:NTE family protein
MSRLRKGAVKVGLVLGAGGFVGGAWLTGALQAIEVETGWLPRTADHIVGTSAGAMIAALTAAGVPAAEIPALFAGKTQGAEVDRALRVHPMGATLRPNGVPNPRLGSVRLALAALRHPRLVPVGVAMAALLPRGLFSTEPLKETVRQVVPDGWATHPKLWLMGCDIGTGERVAFGQEGAPVCDLADAVAASCAIPGFYHPVAIDGHLYVDGGCWSTSNLEVLETHKLDMVICLNPTSSRERSQRWRDGIGNAYRSASGRQLGAEAGRLRRRGTRVVLVQPSLESLVVMGNNLMRSGELDSITEVARASVMRQLRTPEYRYCISVLRRLGGRPETTPRPQPAAAAARAISGVGRAMRSPVGARVMATGISKPA